MRFVISDGETTIGTITVRSTSADVVSTDPAIAVERLNHYEVLKLVSLALRDGLTIDSYLDEKEEAALATP